MKKRIFDILVCLLAIPVAMALCFIIGIPIALEAKASPFFFQWRIGVGEKKFRILKLRTMKYNTPSVASHDINPGYLLKTGRLARVTKIDELPQLWNVLLGEMSIVGPRPCLPEQIELVEARRKNGIFALRPGITGISQVQGLDMSTPNLLAEVDAIYLQPWSFRLDLRIILLTAIGKGRGDASQKAKDRNPN